MGLALIQIANLKYRIILYKDKQHILSTYDFTEKHKITIHNLYCYFTDNLLKNWSVLFENEKDISEFSSELKSAGMELEISHKPIVEEESNVIKKTEEMKVAESCDIKDTKAKILNLMEKMGQTKLLPEIQSSPIDNTTDSSDTENVKKPSKPLIKPRKFDTRTLSSKPSTISSSNAMSIVNPTQYVLVNGQLVPFSQDNIIQNLPVTSNSQWIPSSSILTSPVNNDSLNMYICENRIHNSELRMNISKVEQKLEKVLDKMENTNKMGTSDDGINLILDYIKRQTEQHNLEIDLLNSKLKHRESFGGKSNAESISSENGYKLSDIVHRQEQEISDYKKEINILQLKLKDFEVYYKEKESNSKKYEIDALKIQEQEREIKSLSLKIKAFEDKEVALKKYEEDIIKLEEQEKKINNLNLQLKDYEEFYKNNTSQCTLNNEIEAKCNEKDNQILQHEKTIDNLKLKLNDFEQFYKEHTEKIAAKDNIIEELNYKLQRLEETNIQLKEKLNSCELSKNELNDRLTAVQSELTLIENNSGEITNQKIKSIMNEVFGLLSNEFDANNTYDGLNVLKSCKRAIKLITLSTLNIKKEGPPLPPEFDG